MEERFERLYKLPDNLYIEGSPIIISAGVLLKDNATGNAVAQIKFHSVTENIIKAVKVSLCAYDVSSTEVQGVNNYQYLDLSIRNGQEFGSNKAIVLPSMVTRSFAISGITVIFSDDSQWQCKNISELKSLPISNYLSNELSNIELVKQYKITTTHYATYVPSESMSIWNCTCGEWNKASRCTKCGSTKQSVFSALNVDELKISVDKRIATEKAQQEYARLAATEAENKRRESIEIKKKSIIKKIKITTAIVIPVVVIIILFTQWLLPDVIQPAVEYKEAERLLVNGDYSEAITAFESLKDYKDSKDKLIDAKYNLALLYLSQTKDTEAFNLFMEVREYADTEKYLSKFDFTLAKVQSDTRTDEYNENEMLTKTTYDSGNTLTYDYDSLNRKIKCIYISDNTNTTTTYEYDSAGNLILERETGNFGNREEDKIEERDEYVYSSENKLIKETHTSVYEEFGSSIGFYEYEYISYHFYDYDTDGQLYRRYYLTGDKYFGDDFLCDIEYTEYTYDDNGISISETEYKSDDSIWIKNISKLKELDDKTIKEIQKTKEIQSSKLYSYVLEDDLKVEETWIINDKPSTIKYEYQDGKLISEIHNDYTLTYLYDEFGNLKEISSSSGSVDKYTYIPNFVGNRP